MTNYAPTLTSSSYGISISPLTAEARPKTPGGLVVTQAVQTKDGWLGQVIVDKEIVWESEAFNDGEEDSLDAVQAANAKVVQVFRALFAPSRRRPST